MENNDILRRIRYTFDFDDDTMMAIFAEGEGPISRAQLSDWLKKDEDPAFRELSDKHLAVFLNGFINHKRGRQDGPPRAPETRLNNNLVLKKLKIALNLQTEDIMAIFELAEKKISPHELSSFFRKHTHPKYRACQDQYLRNFLTGLQLKYRNPSA